MGTSAHRTVWASRGLLAGAIAVVMLCGTLPAPAGSDIATGDERATLGSPFRVTAAAALGDADEPDVAYGPGEYLVVWSDRRATWRRIYAQRVALDGTRIGGNIRISGTQAVCNTYSPEVGWDPVASEYVIVWRDCRRFDPDGSDIYGQRLSATGERLGTNFKINSVHARIIGEYAIACDTLAGGCLVVWKDLRNLDTRHADIYGRRIASGGGLAGPELGISDADADGAEEWPAVAFNPDRRQYAVVWQAQDSESLDVFIVIQRLRSTSGVLLGTNNRLTNGECDWPNRPSVAYDQGAEEYRVVFTDHGSPFSVRDFDTFSRRVTPFGIVRGNRVMLSGGGATGFEHFPDVAAGFGTGSLVAWQDERKDAIRGSEIYGQVLDASGRRVGRNIRLGGGSGDDEWAAVATDPSTGVALVVWEDARNEETRGTDIWGRLVAP
jgi:hypothetical protein